MRFKGQTDFDHNKKPKIGVLLTNLGTPQAATGKALRVYLKQFLSDPRVVEIPRIIWWFILNVIILNVRPNRSAKLYQSVWTDRGSPLLFHTVDQANAIREKLQHECGDNNEIIVHYAMRYGQPSVESELEKLQHQGASKILVLPLYPQYSGATTGSTFDVIAELFSSTRWIPDFRFVSSYHDDERYIQACVDQIKQHWQHNEPSEKLMLSYHGVPKRYLESGDPYYCQCQKTSRLIREKLGLDEQQCITTFQSRFGKAEWLKPYTDETLKELGQGGTLSIDVFCPGFSADCLETLEEIAVENKEYFIEAGGHHYSYISALNSEANHIDALTKIIKNNINSWLK
tara:strand:- start:1295 stop:2326 length:1032 start_codon:yes stop_codon:yes gene_type:complete